MGRAAGGKKSETHRCQKLSDHNRDENRFPRFFSNAALAHPLFNFFTKETEDYKNV